MERVRLAAVVSILLLHGASASIAAETRSGSGVPARRTVTASQKLEFRGTDLEGQRIARRLLAKKITDEARYTSGVPELQTAWVILSASARPALFVLYGCSPTGNCGLYGFERSNRGWRQILDSIAQTCAVLPSSHDGWRDLSASMHGGATQSTIKTYWWRKNRYVRVSAREVTLSR